MSFESAICRDEEIEAARDTVARMRHAAEANPAANNAEIPVATFLGIAKLLETLVDRLEHSKLTQPGAAMGSLGRDPVLLINTLAAVPTMGGGCLSELLAPSEIREIADAVIATLNITAPQPQPQVEEIGHDFLERLFKQYR